MIGEILKHYKIESQLGAGGMGVVYRALDMNLGRRVALKVLPETFAQDPDRISRFRHEAKLLASLNHQNIATLYGLEEDGGKHFLVMELVEGETLADRLRRGPMTPEDALKIAHQIAEALELAHETGVIHRDLKPANVMITPDGRVKVLDFGLAKAMESPGVSGHPMELSNLETLHMTATREGVILGTAAYLSPERANGAAVDRRGDIFSFGVVLFEMISGRQPFRGRTVPEIVASVLVEEPDWSLVPSSLRSRISSLIRRCLEKNPKRRWQAIGDIRLEVEALLSDPLGLTTRPPSAAQVQSWWKFAILAVVTAVVVGVPVSYAVWNFKPAPPMAITKFPIVLPEGQNFTVSGRELLAASPDGLKLVYAANDQLYLRPTGEMAPHPIPGTGGGASGPFFSPDGQSVGFWTRDSKTQVTTLWTIPLSGGTAQPICKIGNNAFGSTWFNGQIYFGDAQKGIMHVSEKGGEPAVLVAVKVPEIAYGPQLLNGGKAILFTLATAYATDRWEKAQIVVQRLPSGERVVIGNGGDAHYLPSGHIIYAKGGTIFAMPFDVKKLMQTGKSAAVIDGVRRAAVGGQGSTGAAHLAFALIGTVFFVPGQGGPSTADQNILAIADRNGKVERLPNIPPGPYFHARMSSSGKQIVFETKDARDQQISIYDISTRETRVLTSGGQNAYPIWSPDDQYVIFQSNREGDKGLWRQLANGNATAERLTKAESGVEHQPGSIDKTGTTLMFQIIHSSGTNQITRGTWTLTLGDHRLQPFVEQADRYRTVFSRDGKWLAYSNGDRIIVQPFPATGVTHIIATGHSPVWGGPNGMDLFYISASTLYGSRIRMEPTVSAAVPTMLPIPGLEENDYDTTPDDKFLVIAPVPTETDRKFTPQINVILSWFEELKQHVPTR